MSQPCRLYPNGCPGAPPLFDWPRSQNFGSVAVKSEGKTATMIRNRMSNAEMTNVGLRRRSCQASDHRLRGFPTPPASAPTSSKVSAVKAESCEGRTVFEVSGMSDPRFSDISDPRVENGVEKVHEQIGEQVDDDQDDYEGHDGGRFTTGDRLVERAADTVHVEDPFGHDRAAHQGAEVGAQVRHHGDQRAAQQVHGDDSS